MQSTAWYVRPDGSLDIARLLEAFQAFFREHSEHWVERFWPQGGEAGREAVRGAGAMLDTAGETGADRPTAGGANPADARPGGAANGSPGRAAGTAPPVDSAGRRTFRHVVECKVLRGGLEQTIAQGLSQTTDYMDRCKAESGHLVIFDRTGDRAWEDRIFRRDESLNGRVVTVWGM